MAMTLTFREATIHDIDEYMIVRMAVRENILNSPELVAKVGEEKYLTVDGKGWVCEIENRIIGFGIIDLLKRRVWALFVHPEFEKMGIGKNLHHMMLTWYFNQTNDTITLTTDPETRAELFYKTLGWKQIGFLGKEVKLEMTSNSWKSI